LQLEARRVFEAHQDYLVSNGANQAAGIIVENATGRILAYVGSSDWNVEGGSRIDMVRAHRTAGSILKPFGYALAYDRGLAPSEPVADIDLTFGDEAHPYHPQNIDLQYLGPIAAAEALALSRNVPAVQVGERIGTRDFLSLLRVLGFEAMTEGPEHYGPAIMLGVGEVSLWELASAYTAFSRRGERIELTWSAAGAGAEHRAYSAAAAGLMAENLSSPVWRARFLNFGMAPPDLGFEVGTKTGTSQDHIDTWAVAFSTEITVAVWVGNTDGSPTRGLTGGTGAGPIAVQLMKAATGEKSGRSSRLWEEGDLEPRVVCPLSGHLRNQACPEGVERLFHPEYAPDASCELHRRGRVLESSSVGSSFVCDPSGEDRAVVLPESYGAWIGSQETAGPLEGAYDLRWFSADRTSDCTLQLGSSL
jgi:penicillin-binding protein 1C